MQLISDDYKNILTTMHKEKEDFGVHSKRYVSYVMNLCHELNSNDLLDYGCGKGVLQQNLPFQIKQYDPGIPVHSLDPESADIVFCSDVMEHVEPEFLDNVLKHINEKTKVIALFVIDLNAAKKTLPDGRNAHLIVENGHWWFNKLSQYFTINSYSINMSNLEDKQNLEECIILAFPKKELEDGKE